MTIKDLPLRDTISVALETNGRGFIGFLVELPGAFVRGKTEIEALSKIPPEAASYLAWLGTSHSPPREVSVVECHSCNLNVEDADSEILLKADAESVQQDEFERLTELCRLSGETFVSLYDSSQQRDWIDQSRERRTFYGETPKTIQEIFNHVESTQDYYLTRVGLKTVQGTGFLDVRESGLTEIETLFGKSGNSVVYEIDRELWTLKKVLRRFIWHDRIHGKAIMRILAKQKRLGLIDSYQDPFHFWLSL